MRFFDSTAYRVSLQAVSDDIAADLAFERSLRKLHEQKLRQQTHQQQTQHKHNAVAEIPEEEEDNNE